MTQERFVLGGGVGTNVDDLWSEQLLNFCIWRGGSPTSGGEIVEPKAKPEPILMMAVQMSHEPQARKSNQYNM